MVNESVNGINPSNIVWSEHTRLNSLPIVGSTSDVEHNTPSCDAIPVTKSEVVHGTKHCIARVAPGYLNIGCRTETIEWWLSEEGAKFATEHGYSSDEIQEYREHFKAIKKFETSS